MLARAPFCNDTRLELNHSNVYAAVGTTDVTPLFVSVRLLIEAAPVCMSQRRLSVTEILPAANVIIGGLSNIWKVLLDEQLWKTPPIFVTTTVYEPLGKLDAVCVVIAGRIGEVTSGPLCHT